jgi:hypothetical protein
MDMAGSNKNRFLVSRFPFLEKVQNLWIRTERSEGGTLAENQFLPFFSQRKIRAGSTLRNSNSWWTGPNTSSNDGSTAPLN